MLVILLVTKSQLLLILCDLLPVFIIEGQAKFQLKVSENTDKHFFPIQINGPPEFYPRTYWAFMDPRLRTSALEIHEYSILIFLG